MFDTEFRTEVHARRDGQTTTLVVPAFAIDVAIDVATAADIVDGFVLAGNRNETALLAQGLLAARATAGSVDGIGVAAGDGASAATGSERAVLHQLATFIDGSDLVEIGADIVGP